MVEDVYAQQPQTQESFSEQIIEVSGPKGNLSEQDETRALMWLGVFLLGILLFEVLQAYKHQQTPSKMSQAVLQQLQEKRRQLFQEIALLDDQFARGDIEKRIYTVERKRCKQRLVELTILCKIPS